MLRVSIGHRLFVAIALSFAALAVAGVALVHWRLFDGAAARPDAGALANDARWLQVLADAVETRFAQAQGWTFLPAGRVPRARWLQDLLASEQAAHRDLPAPSPTLGYRVGLLDVQHQPLAGAVPAPAIVAFASIDRRETRLARGDAAIGYLVLAKPQGPDDELAVAFLVDQQSNLGLLLLAGIVLSAATAMLLAARFRAPIAQLAAGARRLGRGELDARVGLQRGDELGQLATTFNDLAAKLEQVDRSRRQWVADTSHELRTPLAVLRAQLEGMQDGIRACTPEHLGRALQQVASLSTLVDDLHQLARADEGATHLAVIPCDVWLLARDVATQFAPRFDAAGLSVDVGATPASSRVRCDPQAMQRVFNNLFENALRHTDPGGRIRLEAASSDGVLRLSLEDTAPGVPAALLDRLGERFFRVDASRSRTSGGSGLGLALCRQLLQAQGAGLAFAASTLGGLRVTITMPLLA